MSRRACRVLTIVAGLLGGAILPPGPALGQSGPSAAIPRGVISLSPGNRPAEAATLAHPLVAGVAIRTRWQDVEPAPGLYDWGFLDAEIERARLAGKRVLLRVIAGGVNTPGWLFDAGVQTFSFVDDNPYRSSFGDRLRIPVFWDSYLLARKTVLLEAMGQHFGGRETVGVVAVSCANATSGDWNVPSSPPDVEQWLALGYTTDRLVDACRRTIDAAMAAFPTTPVAMAIGQTPGLDADPHESARRVVETARAAYPGRFIAQKNTLSARTRDPQRTVLLGAWQTIADSQPEVAGQMLWYVTGDATCRMAGGVTPCDPATVLQEAVTIGARYGLQYQEVYEADLANPALAPVVTYAADLMSTPTTPTALLATVTSRSVVKLRWGASTDAVGVVAYGIYRNGVRVATTPGRTYTDRKGLVPGSTYEYRVSALDAVGNESQPSTAALVRIRAPFQGSVLPVLR